MRKLSYKFVKKYISSVDGYSLLSKDYINARSKMDISHICGNIFKMSFSKFQSGRRCPVCSKKRWSENKRLLYDYVKNKIESAGYKLLSKEYKGSQEKLTMVCSKNHIIDLRYNDFHNGNRCGICYGNRKLKFERVKEVVESFEGYILISKEYKNAMSKIKIQCPKGHIINVVYNDFRHSKGSCGECRREQTISKEEKEITSYIKQIYTGTIIENDRTQLVNPFTGYNLELDIWLPEIKKAIEYNGKYWHDGRENIDIIKQNQCIEKGINLMVINDIDWKQNKNFELIQNFIGG